MPIGKHLDCFTIVKKKKNAVRDIFTYKFPSVFQFICIDVQKENFFVKRYEYYFLKFIVGEVSQLLILQMGILATYSQPKASSPNFEPWVLSEKSKQDQRHVLQDGFTIQYQIGDHVH